MKNSFFEIFNSIIKLKVEGKNINNYIKRLIKDKINIIKYIPISYKEAIIVIKYSDYLKIKEYRTIYKLTIISKHGKIKFKENILKYICSLSLIIISITILYVLSNIIFNIEVIHSSSEIKSLVLKELNRNGIHKYIFKRSYEEIEQIEDKILENNKDKIEWIEITENGTSYIVRVEERKLKEEIENENNYDIISTKNAIIYSIEALKGEKIKKTNDYVNKGDTIISGSITKPDGNIIVSTAEGEVYGEVWYTIDISYPFIYKEETQTGKNKEVYVINFLGKRISLFDFNKFKTYSKNTKLILNNNFLPISLVKEKQYELNVVDEYYTEEEAINKAIELSKDKLLNNDKIKEIKNITILEKNIYPSKVGLKLFVSVIENIGEYKKIELEE